MFAGRWLKMQPETLCSVFVRVLIKSQGNVVLSTWKLIAASFSIESVIQGYHVYKDTWESCIGEELKKEVSLLAGQ